MSTRQFLFLSICAGLCLVTGMACADANPIPWDNWTMLSGAWEESDGVITGHGEATGANLATTAAYRDFELDLEYAIEGAAEASLFFRAHWLPALPAAEGTAPADLVRRIYGYELPVSASPEPDSVGIYDRSERAMIASCFADAQKTMNPTGWNRLTIKAQGPIIELTINGVMAARLFDERFIKGCIALQARSTDDINPGIVKFHAVKIQDLHDASSWKALFNGTNLDGWKNWGEEIFVVEDGAIIGRSGPKKSEGYLCTEKTWTDFRVKGSFKMLGEGNFGLFYHSTITLREDGYPIIKGVQGEVEPSWPGSTGWHYESYKRGWIIKPDTTQLGAWALRPDEWNEIEIRALGNRITTWVNGIRTTDITDDHHQVFEGGFALQLHSGGVDGITWKDIAERDPFLP